MILLDTDHLTVLRYLADPRSTRLNSRLQIAVENEDVGTTIISVEEQIRGWLARLHAESNPRRQIVWYEKLDGLLSFFQAWNVELFDAPAAEEFVQLRARRIRIGTQDLKIAAIAITRDAVLLSANLRDFSRIPGLKVEDWMNA